MTDPGFRPRRSRIRRLGGTSALVAVLVGALVAGTSSAAFALWSASGTTSSSATLGKVSGAIAGTSSMTTTFSSTTTSLTAPLTFTDTGSLAGTYSATPSISQGPALAAAVDVSAWPVAAAADCTAQAPIGSGSVSGTWAQLPAMTGSIASGATAVWCTRSTPSSSAPASSTAYIAIGLTVSTTTGGWNSAVATGAFYLNTSAATAALTCTDYDGSFHVRIAWDASTRSADTYYGLQVAGTRVDPAAQGYTGYIDLAGADVPSSVAPDGPARIDVAVLDADQEPTGQLAATGTVTFTASNGSRLVTCGG